MKPYSSYSVEEFVQDRRFRAWVKHPTPEEDTFWEQWLSVNPHLRPTLDEARAIVLAIHPVESGSISDDEIAHEIQAILQHADDAEEDRSARSILPVLKIAASVSILLLCGWYAWHRFSDRKKGTDVLLSENYVIEQVNQNEKPLLVNLPDNSSVLLSQHCLIRYPNEFRGDTRQVYLSGEAFFEVTKDPEKPFYVEAGQVVAKVLGTSFEINTLADKQTRIIVRSGSVSIYSKSVHGEDIKDQQPDIILGKDDQLIVKGDVNELQRTRLNSASPERLHVPDTHINFSGTPVSKVFSFLARTYGVKIDYSNASIERCSVTASFTDEPFRLKLDLICRSIGLEYQLLDNGITISGEGCSTH